ncbi:MAG: hypothetical protein AAF918_12560 [Pseudomonadota bacterium]
MFDIAVNLDFEQATSPFAMSARNLRQLVRGAFDVVAHRIEDAELEVEACRTGEDSEQPLYLCCLRLTLRGDVPIQAVSMSNKPTVAVTRALQRGQQALEDLPVARSYARDPGFDHRSYDHNEQPAVA